MVGAQMVVHLAVQMDSCGWKVHQGDGWAEGYDGIDEDSAIQPEYESPDADDGYWYRSSLYEGYPSMCPLKENGGCDLTSIFYLRSVER